MPNPLRNRDREPAHAERLRAYVRARKDHLHGHDIEEAEDERATGGEAQRHEDRAVDEASHTKTGEVRQRDSEWKVGCANDEPRKQDAWDHDGRRRQKGDDVLPDHDTPAW